MSISLVQMAYVPSTVSSPTNTRKAPIKKTKINSQNGRETSLAQRAVFLYIEQLQFQGGLESVLELPIEFQWCSLLLSTMACRTEPRFMVSVLRMAL